jgi:transcriptional regulator with XRE-family HTH domain
MAELKLQNKKEWAKLLFIKENITQKEIAQKVGVTEKTISKWVNTENWEQFKASIIITKEEGLKRIYMQINEVNSAIEKKPQGERYATGKEADILVKLAASARSLETETSISDVIEVFKRFINWLRPIDLEKAKEIIIMQDNYIKTILK